ncbi:hypothetical protein [Pseudomonas yamanorum]
MSRVPEVDSERPLNAEEYDMIDSVYIDDLAEPLKGFGEYDGGIGLRHVEHDLVVTLVPPEKLPLNSQIYLYWSDPVLPVDYIVIQPENQGNRYFDLRVPKEQILADWAEVYCIIRRPSGNPSKTRPLTLRVKRDRPGDLDPDADTPGHQGLVFTLPEDLAAGSHVDERRAERGVRLTVEPYENMAAGDTCIFAWGSQTVSYVVSAKEVQRSFEVVVTADVIREDPLEATLPVAMQIMDMVGNYPAPNTNANWSEISRVEVDLGVYRPRAPYLEQPGETIDMEKLGGAAQKILLWVDPDFFEIGDTVRLQWQGRDIQNVPFFYTDQKLVGTIPQLMEFKVENELLRVISGGIAIMYYEVYKIVTNTWYPSRKVRVRVIGQLMDWPAPTIDQAPNGQLAPTSIATVRVPVQDGWASGTKIRMVWVASSVNYTEERFLVNIPEDRRLSFTVPSAEVRRFNTLPVEVYYERIDHTPHRPSLRMQLQVGEPARTLPAVTVSGTSGDYLNPDDVGDQVIVTLPVTDTLQGDIITLIWDGDVLDTLATVHVSKDQAGKPLQISVLKRFVSQNLDRSIRIRYDLARANVPRRFSLIRVLLIRSGFDHITNFRNSNQNGWAFGSAVIDMRDRRFYNWGSYTTFYNYTHGANNKSGIIFTQAFGNLRPGSAYIFSIRVRRFDGRHTFPSIGLRSSQGQVVNATQISNMDSWRTLSGSVTPSGSSLTLFIDSHQASSEGNDYEIGEIRFRLA